MYVPASVVRMAVNILFADTVNVKITWTSPNSTIFITNAGVRRTMDVCSRIVRRPLLLAIAAAVVLSACVALITAESDGSDAADNPTGRAGNDLEWEYKTSTGTLRISGTGPMWDFDMGGMYGLPGWRNYTVNTVTISEGVTTVGKNAFTQPSIAKVTLPSTVVEIHSYSFSNTSLTRVTLPAGLKTIGEYAFVGTQISSLTLPEGIEYIGEAAFAETNITSLTIPASLRLLGPQCFRNTNITSLTIPSTMKSVSQMAFSSSPISNLTIEEGVETIEGAAFSNIMIRDLVIPDSITRLDTGAFSSCQNLASVRLGAGMKELNGGVFNGCSSLQNVVLGENITKLDRCLFSGCPNLKRFNITATVNYLVTDKESNGNPFTNSSLVEITVDPKNKYYESFEGVLFTKSMGSLVAYPPGKEADSYTIPACVFSVEDYAFYGVKMDTIIIPDSVVSIGRRAINVNTLVVPDNVSQIDYQGISAEHITIGDGIRQVTAEMFGVGLKVLILGANVGTIGEDMKRINSLEEVLISNRNKVLTSLGGIVYDKNVRNLILVPAAMEGTYMMPNTVEYISAECFCYVKFTHITLSDNLKAIGGAAFRDNKYITSIKIPSKVISIGGEAFSGCTNLEMVYFETPIKPSMGYHTFYLGDVHNWGNIRVYSTLPEGFMDRYAGKFTKVEYYDSEEGEPSLLEETLSNPLYVVIIVTVFSASLVVAERYISRRRKL